MKTAVDVLRDAEYELEDVGSNESLGSWMIQRQLQRVDTYEEKQEVLRRNRWNLIEIEDALDKHNKSYNDVYALRKSL